MSGRARAMRLALLFGLGLGVAASGSACSPATVPAPSPIDSVDAGDASADGGNTAVDFACQNYAYGYCNRLSACSPTLLYVRYGTQTACEATQRTTCTFDNDAPGVLQTADTTAACTAVLPDWACSDFLYSQNRPPACQNQIAGTESNGAPCAINQQCTSGFCANPASQLCGTCQPVPAAGASCAVYPCPSGLSCIGSTCVTLSAQGASCVAATQPCSEGLTCVGGICQPGVPTAGATCAVAGAGCDEVLGLVCSASSSTCQTLVLAQPGQACGIVNDQNAVCAGGTCVRGACVAYQPIGAPCEIGAASSVCVTSARCIPTADGGTSGTCQFNGSASCE